MCGGSTTINIEPQGAHRLPSMQTLDVRLAKTVRFGARSIEFDFDVSNITNANTTWEMRSLTGRLNLRQGGNPTGALINVPQFMSPSQILAPRIARLGVALRF